MILPLRAGALGLSLCYELDGLIQKHRDLNRSLEEAWASLLTVLTERWPDWPIEVWTRLLPYEEDGEEVPGDISMRILDMLVPIGRGQRALLVSPPRAGKTIMLQKIAQSMQRLYPDVEVIVIESVA